MTPKKQKYWFLSTTLFIHTKVFFDSLLYQQHKNTIKHQLFKRCGILYQKPSVNFQKSHERKESKILIPKVNFESDFLDATFEKSAKH